LSTPTKNDDRHQVIEVKPDRDDEDEEQKNPWWYWFRIEMPPQAKRAEFFGFILGIILLETAFGPVLGVILRSIFGWPF
jgi:hypothetical protein